MGVAVTVRGLLDSNVVVKTKDKRIKEPAEE